MDWPETVSTLLKVKQVIASLDREIHWPSYPPEPGASEADIACCEDLLGFRLDPKYRLFLMHANGWRGFYQTVDLLGTRDLTGGELFSHAVKMLLVMDDLVFDASGIRRAEVLPIAATHQERDLFVLAKPHSSCAGQVLWFAGEEVDRFADFDEYFLAMIDYNREEVRDLAREHGN